MQMLSVSRVSAKSYLHVVLFTGNLSVRPNMRRRTCLCDVMNNLLIIINHDKVEVEGKDQVVLGL